MLEICVEQNLSVYEFNVNNTVCVVMRERAFF
jgi:hypothetical protein